MSGELYSGLFKMTNFARNTLRRLAGETRGAEIAEAAAVLPIMFMILIGIFWFGQAFSIYGTITRAAQEGARAAVGPACTTCASSVDPSAVAYAAVQNALTVAHLNPALLQPPTTTPPLCACGSTAASCPGAGATRCDRNYPTICIQGVQHRRRFRSEVVDLVQLAPVSTTAPASPGVCGISVSFQYPFSFALPFTTLNNRQILLQAQASARAETQ